MSFNWKGKKMRPMGTGFIRVTKPDINELMKPLSMKAGLGSAILTGSFISGNGQEQPTPGVSPTPSPTATVTQTPSPSVTNTPSPTPSITPTMTQTQTPSLTPSSTPYPLPIQPTLWFDGSDSNYMSLILSGGNQYVSSWTSKGTNGWVLSGANTDRMPIYSASTLMPGNPNCVRFTTNATSTLQDGMSSFGNTPIQHTGSTWFLVWAKPSGSTYTTSPLINRVFSGFTNGGLVTSGSPGGGIDNHTFNITNGNVVTNTYNMYMNLAYGLNIPVYSATNLNDKFIASYNNPGSTNGFSYIELNQSAQTNTTSFTGSTSVGFVNNYSLGFTTNSGGTATYNNSNSELCEVMWFNTELTPAQREQVELYLKDKWRYDEWASPVPTATPTASPTQTPTTSVTPTLTTTPTPSSSGVPKVILSGGTVTDAGGFRTHTFTSGGTLTVIQGGSVQLLLVAGGGGGGGGGNLGGAGGGGGGGGQIYTGFTITTGGTVTIGNGGNGGSTTGVAGDNGADSTFLSFTAIGGGGGAAGFSNNTAQDGKNGGNGGGGNSRNGCTVSGNGGLGTAGQGNNGQSGSAGGAGGSSNNQPGYSVGGSSYGCSGGVGNGGNGTANTGNGGGGAVGTAGVGGNGGSGIMKITYAL